MCTDELSEVIKFTNFEASVNAGYAYLALFTSFIPTRVCNSLHVGRLIIKLTWTPRTVRDQYRLWANSLSSQASKDTDDGSFELGMASDTSPLARLWMWFAQRRA